jgi:hypothetical protein
MNEVNSTAEGIKENLKNAAAAKGDQTTPTGNPALDRPVATAQPVMQDRIAPKARYGDRPGEKRIDTKEMSKPLGSFKKGTSHVPKTGVYKLHEGEAVIPKDKNMDSMKDKMMDSLGGDKKPKKEIKEMVHSKSHNGHHIVVHKHHRPEHHPDETHTLEDMAALHQHMDQHAGEPNEGEGPESAPQGGSAAPMTAAPSPAPAAPMQGAQ